jgi:membrane-associated phospholipid phosphatase
MAVDESPSLVRRHGEAQPADERPRLRDTWLIGKREAATLLAIYAVFTGAWFTVGWVLTRPLKDSAVVHNDQSVSEWFVTRRTPRLDSLSYIGSMMSDTFVKIIVTAVVSGAMLVVWKRWLEPLMVVVPLALEALTFVTVTKLVGRPRPDVPKLDSSPIGSSYPSGHVAAAVVYSAIIIVVFWHTRRRWVRAVAVVLGGIVPICVALARLYRGMHFLTDVIFGGLLGGAWVIASFVVIRRAELRRRARLHLATEPWGQALDEPWPPPRPGERADRFEAEPVAR